MRERTGGLVGVAPAPHLCPKTCQWQACRLNLLGPDFVNRISKECVFAIFEQIR